jgi:hypothetical protein
MRLSQFDPALKREHFVAIVCGCKSGATHLGGAHRNEVEKADLALDRVSTRRIQSIAKIASSDLSALKDTDQVEHRSLSQVVHAKELVVSA